MREHLVCFYFRVTVSVPVLPILKEATPASDGETEHTSAPSSVRSMKSKSGNQEKTDRDSPSKKEKKLKETKIKLKPSTSVKSARGSTVSKETSVRSTLSSNVSKDEDLSRFISLALASSLDTGEMLLFLSRKCISHSESSKNEAQDL